MMGDYLRGFIDGYQKAKEGTEIPFYVDGLNKNQIVNEVIKEVERRGIEKKRLRGYKR